MSRIAKHVTLRSHFRRKWRCQLTFIFFLLKNITWHFQMSNEHFQIHTVHIRLLLISHYGNYSISTQFLFCSITSPKNSADQPLATDECAQHAFSHQWSAPLHPMTSSQYIMISSIPVAILSNILTSNILHRINRATSCTNIPPFCKSIISYSYSSLTTMKKNKMSTPAPEIVLYKGSQK